ncbi:MAG TPA: CBS domain-containing protein, partial [Methylomirabilota bacterium]|nr:CBS domain-containing protein [Methylomirabilota bacterium]
EIASRMLSRGISAVPVVDDDGRLVGIVSEADLVARAGEEPDARPSWWSLILKSDADLAAHFVRTHGMTARDVMTTAVVTVGRDTPLTELVTRMGRKRIRRVVVTDGDIPIGLVSRSDVLRAQAAHFDEERGSVEPPDEDTRLRDELLANLQAQPWFHLADRNVVVINGVACFWGIVPSEAERDALRVAAAEIPGIRSVEMKVELGQIYPTV